MNFSLSEQKLKILFAFDLDDTLIKTKANIIVNNRGNSKVLTPAEYAVYEPQPGDEFDYSQFKGLIDPVTIKDTFELFSKVLKASKMLRNAKTIILTARTPSITSDLQKFLDKHNLPDVELHAVGSSDPSKKTEVIQDYINQGFNSIRFYDDSPKNITAVKALEKTNPDVRIQAKLMKHDLTEIIRKVGDEYAVYPKKGGKRLGTHSTRKAAEKQLAAIHINKENYIDGEVNELNCKYGQYFCPHDKIYKCRKGPKKTVSEVITPADPSEVDREELVMGIRVEMEHTDNPEEAAKIALQHLAEDPMYYSKLATLNLEGEHDPMNPGILKKRLGKLSCTKVRKERQGLKDKGTTYAKALQRYLNYHCG